MTPNIPQIKQAILDLKATPLEQITTGVIFDGEKCCAIGHMLKSAGYGLVPRGKRSPNRACSEAYIYQYRQFEETFGLDYIPIVQLNDGPCYGKPNPGQGQRDEVISYLETVVSTNEANG